MKLLAIDCSTKMTCIAVAADGVCKAEIDRELARRQSAELPLLVGQALDTGGVKLTDLDLVAAGKGPGYYTGVRTGVAYAAALAQALGIKVVPLSTLEIFVYDLIGKDVPLAPVLKANRTHVYGALYQPSGKTLCAFIPEGFYSAEEFSSLLSEHKNALLVGSDRKLYEPLAACPNDFLPRLSGFARSAAQLGVLYAGQAVSPLALRGNYLREPDIGPAAK